MSLDWKFRSQGGWTQETTSTWSLVGYQGCWVETLGPGLSLFVVSVPVTTALLVWGLWLGTVPPRTWWSRSPRCRLGVPSISAGIRWPPEMIAFPFVTFGVFAFARRIGRICRRRLLLVRDNLFEHHLVEFVDILHDSLCGLLEGDPVPHGHGQLPSCPLPVEGELFPLLWLASSFGDHPVSIAVNMPFLSPPN